MTQNNVPRFKYMQLFWDKIKNAVIQPRSKVYMKQVMKFNKDTGYETFNKEYNAERFVSTHVPYMHI